MGTAAFGGPGIALPTLDVGPDGSAYLAPNFQFEPVPEPSALALAGLAGAFLIALRRRLAR